MKKNATIGLIVDLLIIFLAGILSLTWFKGDNLINGGDFGMPLDWLKYFRSLFYVWNESYSLGAPDYRQIASLIPYASLGAILQSLGCSLVMIEKIFFYLWFTGSGVSMYYLGRVLKMPRLAKMTAALFYMFNPFSLMIIWRVSHGLIQMPYAFAPLIFGLYLQGLFEKGSFEKRGLKFIIFACLIWLFSTTAAYANPRMVIVHWLPILFYFIWALIFKSNQRIFIFKYTALFLLFWLLLNLYWLLPFVTSFGESFASAHSPFLMPDIEEFKLTSVKVLEGIRMLGYWSLKGGYKGEPYYPYWQFYNLPLINLISWLIPILVILGLLNKKIRKKPLIYFFLGLLIFGLVGINGAHPPFGFILIWLYKLVPPLALLARFNFLFFGMITYLVFSLLLGYGFLSIYQFGIKKFGKLVFLPIVLLFFLLTVVLVFPFWSGEVIKAEGKSTPGERAEVPDYWNEAKNWLGDQKDFFRILPLPMSKTYNVAFNWGEGYSGGDPTRWFTSQPVLNVNTDQTFKVPMALGESIEKEAKYKNVAKILGFLNVRYLLIRNDTRWEFLKGHGWWFYHPPEAIEKFLQKQSVLSLDKKIGQLEFYRLKDEYLLPRIYAPGKITFIDGETSGLEDLAQFLKPEEKEGFIIGQNEFDSDFIWRQPIIPKNGEKKDLSRVFYEIEVERESQYEILLKDDDFWQFYQSKEIGLQVDNFAPQKIIPVARQDNLVYLGKVNLAAGKHLISIFPPPTINLVGNLAFEEKIPLKVAADRKESVFNIPIANFKKGEAYGLSFFSKNLKGKEPLLLIWENYTDSPVPDFQTIDEPFGVANSKTSYSLIGIPLDSAWQNYELTFDPSFSTKSLGISFFSPFDDQNILASPSENLFAKIRVQRVFNNPLILKNLDKDIRRLQVPEISFKRISPVKYEVMIKGAIEPFWLVFSEAFHPNWKITVEGEHQMINGFANGWYIKKTGDFQFEIYFWPQSIIYLGLAISGLTALGGLALLFLKRK